MNTRFVVLGAALLAMSAGCQSAPWKTAGSKLGFGKPLASKEKKSIEDVELVSKDTLGLARQDRTPRTGDQSAATSDNASNALAALKQGHKAEANGQLKQAKGFYHQALELEPKHALAHHRLAIIADKEGDFQSAREHYLAALSVDRNNPNLLSDLGYSFLLQNRTDESKYYLEQALQSDRTHVRALNNLGLLHARQGDYDGALAMFRQTGSEREVAEKMRELFPDGRPQGSGPADADVPLFANQPQQHGLPQVTPAAVGPSPWEDRNGVQSAGGPLAPGGEFRPGAVAARGNDAQQSGAGNPFAGAAAQSGDMRQGSVAGGLTAGVSQTNSRTAPPFDIQAASPRPEDALEEWPSRSSVSQSQPQPGQAAPFPMDSDWPPRNGGAPAGQVSDGSEGIRAISAVGGPGGANPAGVHINAHHQQPAANAQLDPRQQAAMLGLNAGPGGVFPMTYGNPAPAQQPNDPNLNRPRDDAAQYNNDPLSSSGATSAYFEAPAPAGGYADPRYRTAARPIAQPAATDYARQSADAGGYAPQYQQPAAQQYQRSDAYAAPDPRPYPNANYAQPGRQQLPQYEQQRPQYPAGQSSQPPAGSAYPPQQPYDGRYAPQQPAAASQAFPSPAPAFNPGNTYQPGTATR